MLAHAVRNASDRLVEVEKIERATNQRTAMLLFFNVADPLGKIKVQEFAQLGKKLRVPTLIDAAADVPPVENYTRFLKSGSIWRPSPAAKGSAGRRARDCC